MSEAPKVRVEPLPPPDPPLPSKERLVALALDTYRLSLGLERTYKNSRGVESTIPQPDIKGACECLKIAATIAGYIGVQPQASRPSRQQQEADKEAEAIARGESLDAETALLRMRKRLEKVQDAD